MSDTATDRQSRGDRLALDHMATCGRCGDMHPDGVRRCGCGSLLYGWREEPRPTLAQLQEMADATPEPAKSDMVAYWLTRFTDDELAVFIAGVA